MGSGGGVSWRISRWAFPSLRSLWGEEHSGSQSAERSTLEAGFMGGICPAPVAHGSAVLTGEGPPRLFRVRQGSSTTTTSRFISGGARLRRCGAPTAHRMAGGIRP